MISTKGRYSIRILLDLAEHRGVGYTPIKDVAARQSISLKYVEKLMPALKNAGLLDSSHGIGGGYRLNRDPEQYDLWEILRVTEGELAPVSCLQTDAGRDFGFAVALRLDRTGAAPGAGRLSRRGPDRLAELPE